MHSNAQLREGGGRDIFPAVAMVTCFCIVFEISPLFLFRNILVNPFLRKDQIPFEFGGSFCNSAVCHLSAKSFII